MSDDTTRTKRVYRGYTTDDGDRRVLVVSPGTAKHRDLKPRHDLRNHSPTGFNWGYGGSGPAQLALALVADALCDDERALTVYQDFKWRVVARLDNAGWELTDSEVRRVVTELEGCYDR